MCPGGNGQETQKSISIRVDGWIIDLTKQMAKQQMILATATLLA